jgi:hypothetical protein
MSFVLPSGAATLTILGYAVVIALSLSAVFALLLIPSLLPPGARPGAAAKALFCYFMQFIGIALMTLSGLPAVIGVAMGIGYPHQSYLALLMIFAIGGLLFLWYENRQGSLDPISSAVPHLLFHYTLKFTGFLTSLLAALTLLAVLLFPPPNLLGSWWIIPLIIFFYGVFLSWCTLSLPQHDTAKPAPAAKAPSLPVKPFPRQVAVKSKKK